MVVEEYRSPSNSKFMLYETLSIYVKLILKILFISQRIEKLKRVFYTPLKSKLKIVIPFFKG